MHYFAFTTALLYVQEKTRLFILHAYRLCQNSNLERAIQRGEEEGKLPSAQPLVRGKFYAKFEY